MADNMNIEEQTNEILVHLEQLCKNQNSVSNNLNSEIKTDFFKENSDNLGSAQLCKYTF